jgi:hypothetical protein
MSVGRTAEIFRSEEPEMRHALAAAAITALLGLAPQNAQARILAQWV